MVLKKKAATGSMGYVVMFTMALLMVVLTLYMAQVARLMTHQHHVDDSLADSVLASLVADSPSLQTHCDSCLPEQEG